MVEGMTVTVLGAGDWVLKRELRLRALQESPGAFASTYERERHYSEGEWRDWPRDGIFFVASGPADHSGAHDADHDRQHRERRPHSIACGWLPLREPDVANLISMWVAPRYRGRRVAAALIDAVVDWARGQDRDHLELEVAAGNEAARKAYERYGFAATSKEPFTEGGTVYSFKLR
jgi:GNAT superfamily N-acetyltransferase